MARKRYSVQTLSKAIYSLGIHAYDINEAKNEALLRKENADKYFRDLRFCYNLKYLAMQKMIKQKHLIFQEFQSARYKGKSYLFSLYRNKDGMPFRQPTQGFDLYATIYSYDVPYESYFLDDNQLEAFYSLSKTIKILLRYVRRSQNAVRYMTIDLFNNKNTKEMKQ